MDTRPPDTSGAQSSTPNQGDSLRLTGGNQDFPNSTRLLYRPIQTCRMVLVPIILGSSYVATAGTLVPLHLT